MTHNWEPVTKLHKELPIITYDYVDIYVDEKIVN